MKKFLAGIAAAAIITIPMTSFALESMSKGALKKATGQAGVSIALDNIVIVQRTMPTTTFWDVDGTSSISGTIGNIAGAGVQISYEDATAQKMIVLDGILDNTKYGVAANEAAFHVSASAAMTGISAVGINAAGQVTDPSNGDIAAPAGMYLTGISPLSIDIGTCQSLTAGLQYNLGTPGAGLEVAGVVIGLPTLEITTYHTNDVKVISVVVDDTSLDVAANSGNNSNAATANISNELIRIEKAGVSQMAILGGRLEIAPH